MSRDTTPKSTAPPRRAGETPPLPDADEGEAETDASGPLSPSEVHGLLKNPRRRYVVWDLSRAEGPVELRDLAGRVAAWENDKPVEGVTSTERKRSYVALYQSHLPRLDEAGVLDFDSDRGVLERGEYADQVERVLGQESEAPWSRFYLLAALGAVLGLLGTLAVGGSLSPLATAYVVATCFTFAAIATADDLRSDRSVVRRAASRLRRRGPSREEP